MRRQQVQRARQRVALARRRYLAVDPDNRLVADSLEADWNDALRALQAAQDDYDNTTSNSALSEQQQTQIRALATDFPALWADPDTPQRERKRMVRLMVNDVILVKTDQIHAHVRLRGGQTHSLTVPIPPRAWQLRQTHPDTLAALDRHLNEHTDAETAALLNAAGHRSGEGKPFTSRIVLDLRRGNNLPSRYERLRARGLLTITELARHLGVHPPLSRTGTRPNSSSHTRPPTRTNDSMSESAVVLRVCVYCDPASGFQRGERLCDARRRPTGRSAVLTVVSGSLGMK
jgi:hypothetical protein